MKILLDTCEFLWLVSGDPKLSASVASVVRDPRNQVFFCLKGRDLPIAGTGPLLRPIGCKPDAIELREIEALPSSVATGDSFC
jgi:hypothetical protein